MRWKGIVKACLALTVGSVLTVLGLSHGSVEMVYLEGKGRPGSGKGVPGSFEGEVSNALALQAGTSLSSTVTDVKMDRRHEDVVSLNDGASKTQGSINGKLNQIIFSSKPFVGLDRHKRRQFKFLIKRFPRIMIIGFGKTGTRALFDTLKMHPDLLGPIKEPRFFSDYYDKGLFSYLNYLPEPTVGGFIIEKSPDYITDELTPSRILASAKELKINPGKLRFVVMLRDPIDRAMSEYLEWKLARQHNGKEKLPPFHVMSIHSRNGTVDGSQPFIRFSNYAIYIKHWFEYFNKTQTCFVDGDRFVTDPYSEIHLLESCLKLKPYFSSDNFVYEAKRGFYCFRSSKNQTEPRCMNSSKGRKHPDIPDKVLANLLKFYQPLDAQLLQLTGRLMQWQQSRGE